MSGLFEDTQLSVQGSWKNAIFCAREVFAVTPFTFLAQAAC